MSDERFARQYRYEPPPEFPLASPCTRIVHHLSGPNICALTRINHEKRSVDSAGLNLPISHFHYAYEFTTQILAYMLDSLVRVTRRAE